MTDLRLPDWSPRLDAVVRAGRSAAFIWGAHDCLAFPAKGIEAVIGIDLFQPFRGRYSDEGGARALVPDIPAYLTWLAARRGWEAIQGHQARRGDLAAINLRGTWMGGLAYDGWLVAREKGYTRLPLRAAGMAWRIGA